MRANLLCWLLVLLLIKIQIQHVSCAFKLSRLLYDDSYITKHLDGRYPYLKRQNGTYIGIRDHFNFSLQFQPTNEYMNSVNIEKYLFYELRATAIAATRHFGATDIWQYSNQDELLKSGWPDANEPKCRADLSYLSNEIELASQNSSRLFDKGRKNIELLRWIDSWGRPVSETYYGNSYWVGSYRGCKYAKVPLVSAQNGPNDQLYGQQMEFRYCWGKLVAKDWPDDDEMIPRTSLRVGLCLPKSCDTILANNPDNKRTIYDILTFNFSPLHKERFNRLIDIYCLPNRNDLPKSAKVFLSLSGAWLCLILIASVSLACLNKKYANVMIPWPIKYLTIQENYARFVAIDAPPTNSRTDLRPLGVIKLFASLGVCFGHCFVESYWTFHSSSILLIEERKVHWHLMGLFLKTLEMFMVLSGLLASYVILSKFPKEKINQIIRPHVYFALNIARYLRLAPIMIIGLAFTRSTFVHLSDGPFWDYGTYKYSQQGTCLATNWWRILLWPIVFDVTNTGGSHYQHECIPSTWYIITEMKMFLIVPFYVYLLYKRKTIRLKLTIATVLVSMLWHYKDICMQQLIYLDQLFKYGRMPAGIIWISFLESSYFSAINRFHAVAIGLFAGIHLYRYKNNEINKWPFWMRGLFLWPMIGWHLFDMFSSSLAEIQYRNTGAYPSEEFAKLFLVVKPRIDAITFAILALRLATDWAPRLMKNSLTLYKLSKLSYCVYIIHAILIIFVTSATEKSRPDAQPIQLVIMSVFVITTSLLISFPLFILFESPLALLLSHFMDRNKIVKSQLLKTTKSAAIKKSH